MLGLFIFCVIVVGIALLCLEASTGHVDGSWDGALFNLGASLIGGTILFVIIAVILVAIAFGMATNKPTTYRSGVTTKQQTEIAAVKAETNFNGANATLVSYVKLNDGSICPPKDCDLFTLGRDLCYFDPAYQYGGRPDSCDFGYSPHINSRVEIVSPLTQAKDGNYYYRVGVKDQKVLSIFADGRLAYGWIKADEVITDARFVPLRSELEIQK
jgi:hypothetical protein